MTWFTHVLRYGQLASTSFTPRLSLSVYPFLLLLGIHTWVLLSLGSHSEDLCGNLVSKSPFFDNIRPLWLARGEFDEYCLRFHATEHLARRTAVLPLAEAHT
jgi:hypothetical protein